MVKIIKGIKILLAFLAIAFILFFPVMVNELAISDGDKEVATNNDWISFFGSYGGSIFGGLAGALIAFYVAKIQIENQQAQNEHRQKIEKSSFELQNRINNRSFMRADTLFFSESPKMKFSNSQDFMDAFESEVDHVKEDKNRKGAILLLSNYHDRDEKYKVYRDNMTCESYIILEHYGNPDAIFDIEIKMKKNSIEHTLKCYSFSKDELVIMPDFFNYEKLEVKYTTIIGEKMFFSFDRPTSKYTLKSNGVTNGGFDGQLVNTPMGEFASIHL
ncbi:hypothetical protein [Halobacillus litoralis]|uniref:hypothetical protein n=1 Tax=Halobacillus litoralis TaxID=45668 RepID=UPI001CD7F922|nr:hypothetical protein [Halobacillus litoralis]MCA1022137.1 hypothetical protein [Halobacillus litoralis]